MSRITLSGNPSGTGTFTIASPNSNTDRTLTLPDTSGTLLTNAPTQAASFGTLAVDGNNISAVNSLGFRNRIINGNMAVYQRPLVRASNGLGFPTASTGYNAPDRFFSVVTGGSLVNVARSSGPGNTQFLLQVFQASGSSSTMFIGQRIEQSNSYDLAGGNATLSVSLAFGGTVTWTISYANTANTFGTLASPTKTQIATGTFSTTSTLTRFTTTVAIPAEATTGIEILFSFNSSFALQMGDVQFEAGSVATPFERRPIGTELALCQRYCQNIRAAESNGSYLRYGYGEYGSTTGLSVNVNLFAPMRITPALTTTTASQYGGFSAGVISAGSAVALGADGSSPSVANVSLTSSGLTAGRAAALLSNNNQTSFLLFTAEL